jgi:bifunctional pyridoxal-dependent enzyme with beta-cystathionase and maltose regulon repressor activities
MTDKQVVKIMIRTVCEEVIAILVELPSYSPFFRQKKKKKKKKKRR